MIPEPEWMRKLFDREEKPRVVAVMMNFPETDPATYRMWVIADWRALILEELGKLLSFVRKCSISGLQVMRIRTACFTPFGQKDLYNRKVWLYMNEIEAYNKGEANEEELAREWELSGIERP